MSNYHYCEKQLYKLNNITNSFTEVASFFESLNNIIKTVKFHEEK